jgi:C-methyltransferase-like protein/putative zinc binding protein/methyltransferase family protein
MNLTSHHRNDCRLCHSKNLKLVLPLKPSALADSYVPADQCNKEQPRYSLDTYLCLDCGHVQLLEVVDPRILFSHYLYVTSVSLGLLEHFSRYADEVVNTLKPAGGSLAIDIGSNEGALLKNFKAHGLRVLGVDAAQNIAALANAAGIETIADFFTAGLARNIRQSHGPAAILTANNVFAHADALGDMADGIRELLADDGVFVFEVVYLLDLVQQLTFDTIYHEHLSHHSIKPFQLFFRRHGMELFHVERNRSKGGSIRGFVQLASGPRPVSPSVAELLALEESAGLATPRIFQDLFARLEGLKNDLRTLLRDLKAQGSQIAGYGASASVTTLVHHFEIAEFIDFIVDDDPRRQGLYSPGFHIPVLSKAALAERKPDYVLVLAWQYATPIISKNQAFADQGGRFIVPLPELKLI